MKTRPIIFTAASVRAILQGRKTQTCRVIRFPPHTYEPTADWVQSIHQDGKGTWVAWSSDQADLADFTQRAYPDGGGFPCPYGSPGDRLWVRETWAYVTLAANEPADRLRPDGVPVHMLYRADAAPDWAEQVPWQSPIFMPRWASRLTLQIESIRALRLHTLTFEDIIAEGAPFGNAATADDDFAVEWNAINARRGVPWTSNPWVWAVTFSIGVRNGEQAA